MGCFFFKQLRLIIHIIDKFPCIEGKRDTAFDLSHGFIIAKIVPSLRKKRLVFEIKIRVFKARFSDLAYKADYWQGQSCPFLNRPIALVTLTYP